MKIRAMVIAALGVVVAAAAGAAAAGAAATPLDFGTVFPDVPATVHYRAEYTARGGIHHVEAWIDRGVRLKRVTDGDVETQAVRTSVRDPEYRMTVLDHQRKIVTRIDRTNLLRIGNFTEWFELAHALRHPRGPYTLARSDALAGARAPIGRCEWYRLVAEGRASSVCWNQAAGLPMAIVSEQGREVWRVTSLEQVPVAAAVFTVHDAGYVRNNANEDIDRD